MLTRRTFLTGALGGAFALINGVHLLDARPPQAVYCPILMYHYVSTPPPDANATLRDLAVVPELFTQHLDALKAEGFQTISMATLYLALKGEASLPEKPCVLTFDDGHWDAVAIATPQLLARGMMGTFYIVENFVGAGDKLAWGHAAEMARLGMEIGCHSKAHANLAQMTYRAQYADVLSATEAIEANVGIRPTTFCYPYGLYNSNTRRVLRELGYHTSVTTSHSTRHRLEERLVLGRVRVRGGMSVEQLLRRML